MYAMCSNSRGVWILISQPIRSEAPLVRKEMVATTLLGESTTARPIGL